MAQEAVFWVLAVASVAAALGVVLLRDVFRAALLLVVVFLGVAGFFVLLNAEFLAVVQVLIYAGAIAILIIFAIMLTREVQQGNLPNRLQPVAVFFPALLLAGLVLVAVDTEWKLLPSGDGPIPAEAQFREEFVKDQVLRRSVDMVHSNTVAGIPDDWKESLEQDIEEQTKRADERRSQGDLEGAQGAELERDIAVNQIAFLERAGARSGIGELLINDFVLPFEVASLLLLAAVIGALVLVRER